MGIPILGNVLQNPKEQEWMQYTTWSKKYGEIFRLKMLHRTFVIISSRKVATELLEKRSMIYSDRPRLVMAGELMGWDKGVTLISSGDRHRKYRRYLHGTLGATATQQFWDLQERSARDLLRSLLDSPDQFLLHIRRVVTASVVEIAYGHKITSNNDPYVTLAQDAQAKFSVAATPNTFAVDWLPLLRYIPEWFPFASFKRKARLWREELLYLLQMPIDRVKRELDSGSAMQSYTSIMLSKGELSKQHEDEIAWSALSLYTGGADTTVSALATFILVLVRNPHIGHKLRAEMDAVTGRNRLPTFSDRKDLPYLKSCLMEPNFPNGVAHRVTVDDEYLGHVIPKDSTIITNIWAMMHDETVYSDPERFIPERFLGEDRDSALAIFGFGRRICPGMHTAQDTLYILAASIIHAFEISPPNDIKGSSSLPEVKYTTGLISHPLPFSCSFRPRSEAVVAIIKDGSLEG
ncbi:hypothetical protein FRC19_008296 [Serendipita sp. 401]|nr:hypothetical protein FRC19_008296 [Serendipita sp. 401]